VADKFTSTGTKGLKSLMSKMERLRNISSMAVRVGAKPTTGEYKRKKGPDRSESRTAADNVIILRAQAKQGRKVTFTSKAERDRINRKWLDGAETALGGSQESAKLMKASNGVGRALVGLYQRHIEQSVGRGKIKPVTDGTQRRKDREGIEPGLPPLIRTGQLIESFIFQVRRFK
jgi:hypothetical protein